MCKIFDVDYGCESAQLLDSLPGSLEARIGGSRLRNEPALSNVEYHLQNF